ncbi:AAA family ATPase [Tuwongella immobilis]|uniref:AAA+ ATPase domain-containing protein n=1 Tax=Tuwongella immobilis TaxID=692036 RepID=A0A6C2YNT6_9BACT|nr:MoxR family ATPase [Tuwongella immobilis]VIP02552.1 atpase aaa : MoxR-like ATPase OS=Singulisphaera acidiphila (strain ATCC BAA-1392 / DSM 18658 / VKM B-2454 / MOB10) GN=Sinac_1836 PE=4 SV=1: AAA_3 [Tuwongella immobilis]VTS01745.1 atpase aaa : MoxR-like ATPase OS=Singulisphaera acidiphila (strain ATCC BAA-1392 / DSM 18658 / VKM B-2454 / MOB10) GN=Sinac_1836 PE=4 SV=1: AAA_3 [Tuwongella immobilis]
MTTSAKPNPLMAGPLSTAAPSANDLDAIKRLGEARTRLKSEIAKVIIGQEHIVDDLLTALFSRGHCLMIGVPGLAKTLMVRTIAQAIDLGFNRIQFTPDLMPSDITGTDIIEEDKVNGGRTFRFVQGPVFANILLADEINRTPPKTQAALLQAMQEGQVTVSGRTYDLPRPFFVLATQNPIEQEGTYPLPEAQLDRFMFDIRIRYPKPEEELAIAKATTSDHAVEVSKILNGSEIQQLQQIVRRLPISDHVGMYAVNLARSTRPDDEIAPAFTKNYVSWGAGTRAVQYLVLGAKARAAISGDYHVTVDHVKAVAPLVLRHRVMTNFQAEAEGISPDKIVTMLLEQVTPPKADDYR